MHISATDIEAIERATVQAVAPEQLETLPGWLLPMDHGTINRARSAVPLHHGEHDPALLDTILERYAAAGMAPAFRLPGAPSFEGWLRELRMHGFMHQQPTFNQTCATADLAQTAAPTASVELARTPDAAWMAMYLGEGLDPVDGASRSKSLSRATGTLFASLRENGETVACGAASFSHGWLGVHGMRTAAAHRGRGLARGLLLAMAQEALRQGVGNAFLQVDASNAPALALYRRLGFHTAWAYAYWRRAQPARAG
ncbi:GNAT family N-acetyltransferase [Hydrogenophaga sp. 2FB]|uniref:GNAT family N-acetyltransferase n=1 Tax=Hydrogenophaga sp. 2FB TaxID=2502187 RepID=UPI0010F47756|nr:GNAT family N-acetyltransferase [Hydrogenophaga sp. 2FB]